MDVKQAKENVEGLAVTSTSKRRATVGRPGAIGRGISHQLRLLETERLRQLPPGVQLGTTYEREGVCLFYGRAEDLYNTWPAPTCIIADGPYGVGGFPGDLPTVEGLAGWYEPHIEVWTSSSTPQTTLWFWATEIGWATVHPVLVRHGWEYRCCHVWNKGLSHVAGNANSLTLRKFPVVTEVCVQYVKPARFTSGNVQLSMRDWLRQEWLRSGLPMRLANGACGVVNAATRKYLTADHLWYYPPPEMFEAMAQYANENGDPSGRPYFSTDGRRPIPARQWAKLRAKFYCKVGINNVWDEPQVRGAARIKNGATRALHLNQKPLRLIEIAVRASTDPHDVVWEPFGGLCTAAIASHRLGRQCASAEVSVDFFRAAVERLAGYDLGT